MTHGRRWSRLLDPPFLLLVLTGLVALLAPVLAPHDPYKPDIAKRLVPPWGVPGGDPAYPLGTDHLGRDMLSRILYGARVSLAIALLAVGLAAPFGILLGLLAGFYGQRVDYAIMRLVDIQLAIPPLLLAIALIAVLGPGTRNVILTLGLASWMAYARIVRAEVMEVKTREFVEAARALGASGARLLIRHIIPNAISSAIVVASFSVANMITYEAALSFLGVGIQEPTPSWGLMLFQGRRYLFQGWWMGVFPGLAVVVVVLALNLAGDRLRDWLDPTLET